MQYLSIRYTERLAEAGIEPSVGSTGDSYLSSVPAPEFGGKPPEYYLVYLGKQTPNSWEFKLPKPPQGKGKLPADGMKFSAEVLDTWNMTTGDMYFIPRAYPHHIENIGTDDWHFLIFFDQPFPADIGYRASASAYSREVLAAAFNTHIDDLPTFPYTSTDPLIVTRSNALD